MERSWVGQASEYGARWTWREERHRAAYGDGDRRDWDKEERRVGGRVFKMNELFSKKNSLEWFSEGD